MSINNKSKKRSLICGATALLFVFLTSVSSFAQSLATVGENDALGISVGHASNSIFRGPILGIGISIMNTLEIGVSYASLSDRNEPITFDGQSKPASVSVGVFPISRKKFAGIGAVAAVSKDFENRSVDPTLNLGVIFYLSLSDPESSKTYLLTGVAFFQHLVLGFAQADPSFTTVSFNFEFGWLSNHNVSPFFTFSVVTAEESDATTLALSAGIRLPIKGK